MRVRPEDRSIAQREEAKLIKDDYIFWKGSLLKDILASAGLIAEILRRQSL